MKKFFIVFISIFVLIYSDLKSQTPSSIPGYIDEVFNKRGEVYFKFSESRKPVIDQLSHIISIDNIINHEVYAYANRNEFANFLTHNYNYIILTPPSCLFKPKMSNNSDLKGVNTWDIYPAYNDYEAEMYQSQSNYPSLCKVYNLGTLNSGRKILVAKISSNVNIKENKPRFYYTSSMHGDELTGYVSMLRLIDYLLTNYGTNTKVTNLVNNIEIWITPLANPDGTYAGGDNTVFGATRYNANNIDLNRNYKNPSGGDHPDGNAWQPETIINMGFADSMKFTMSVNFHGGSECVNYPWDTWLSSQKVHADDSWWQLVSHQYADTARYYGLSGYMNPSGSNFDNGITNGGDWYVVEGSRQDYLMYYTNTREETIEISNTKTPAASLLPGLWNCNYRSFLNHMQQSLYGLRGIVTDSCTGHPIEAQVFIVGHDVDNSYVYSHLPVGNYHRPLYAGNYTVTFSAPGYSTKTFSNLSISNNNTLVLNVALAPVAPQAVISASPLNSCTGVINFSANLQNADTWQWHFGDGTTDNSLNPVHSYNQNGSYQAYLSVSNCTGMQQINLTNNIVIDKPAPPTVQSASRCGQGSLILSATASGTIYWYNSLLSTLPLDSGATFTTPLITQTTNYYAEYKTDLIEHVGETNSSSNGSFYTASTKQYLIFDCFAPVKLLSVAVNAGSAGNRTFYLRNSSSQIIDSVVVNVPAGTSRVNLNFNIPIGNNLQLVGPLSPNLYRTNSASLTYPYTIQGYLSIKSSSASSNPTSYYYYFYDWEVKLDECISQRVPVIAEIKNIPVPNFSYIVDSLTVNFTNLSNGSDSYFWNFGDGNTSVLENPSHVFSAFGNYNVMLITTNTCGADTVTIALHLTTAAPLADFSAYPLSVPQGSFVQFTDLTTNNPNSWLWDIESGTPSSPTVKNPSVQYNTVGTFYVKLTATNAFGSNSITKNSYITVYPAALAPTADFISDKNNINVGDSVQFTDLSSNNPTSWVWSAEGGTPSSSSIQNPLIKYNTPGIYFVSLTATNSVGSDNEIKYNYIQVNPSSINTLSVLNTSLFVYPDPVKNELFVKVPLVSNNILFTVYDVLGNIVITVKENNISKNNDILKVDVSELSEGMYFIRCIAEKNIYTSKFFK